MLFKFLLALLLAQFGFAAQSYQASGMVLITDEQHGTLTVSENAVPGYMDAMVMSYQVRNVTSLQEFRPGTNIEFTLIVDQNASYVRDVRVRKFDSMARDPVQVRTLELLESTMNPLHARTQIALGSTVQDFALIDQNNHPVRLSQFRGKLVAITFIYTRCPLTDYCFRLSSNFGQLQKRFQQQLGRELVMLSITFDPVHDQPGVLKKYAGIWETKPGSWYFLTGTLDEVRRVCGFFAMNFWPDEGLLTHSLHTALVGRGGELVANIEGNQFTAKQLGDLVEKLLAKT